ncbi:unnamed protein product, partial [marine sediment metagenome]
MSQQHLPTAVRTGDWLARVVPKALVVLLALAVILGGVWTYYDVKWGRELSRELEAWKAQGLPLSMSEVIPKPVPDSENAAPLYLSVFNVSFEPAIRPSPRRNFADLSDEEEDLIDDHRRGKERAGSAAQVRAILSRPEVVQALQTLKRASQYPNAVFPVKWELGFAAVFPHMPRFLDATRMVTVQALVLAEDGQMADAFDWCLVGLRMADHTAMEPSMIAQLVAMAMRNMALGTIEELISARSVPAAAGQALQEHLQGIDVYGFYDQAMRLEGAFGRSTFAQLREKPEILAETVRDV